MISSGMADPRPALKDAVKVAMQLSETMLELKKQLRDKEEQLLREQTERGQAMLSKLIEAQEAYSQLKQNRIWYEESLYEKIGHSPLYIDWKHWNALMDKLRLASDASGAAESEKDHLMMAYRDQLNVVAAQGSRVGFFAEVSSKLASLLVQEQVQEAFKNLQDKTLLPMRKVLESGLLQIKETVAQSLAIVNGEQKPLDEAFATLKQLEERLEAAKTKYEAANKEYHDARYEAFDYVKSTEQFRKPANSPLVYEHLLQMFLSMEEEGRTRATTEYLTEAYTATVQLINRNRQTLAKLDELFKVHNRVLTEFTDAMNGVEQELTQKFNELYPNGCPSLRCPVEPVEENRSMDLQRQAGRTDWPSTLFLASEFLIAGLATSLTATFSNLFLRHFLGAHSAQSLPIPGGCDLCRSQTQNKAEPNRPRKELISVPCNRCRDRFCQFGRPDFP